MPAIIISAGTSQKVSASAAMYFLRRTFTRTGPPVPRNSSLRLYTQGHAKDPPVS